MKEELKDKVLGDVIEKYIGKEIKLGGKSGFFYCGKIPKSYKEFFTDLTLIENPSVGSERAHIRKRISTLDNKYSNRIKTALDHGSAVDFIEVSNIKQKELTNLQLELDAIESDLSDKNLLNCKVKDIYHSQVDNSIMIIIEYRNHKHFVDFAHMIRVSKLHHKLALKYKLCQQ